MGRSDSTLYEIYRNNFPRNEPIAFLGFTENRILANVNDTDIYDYQLNNWDINSEWQIDKKYSSIISTRCPYFAKNPEMFIEQCYGLLNDNGQIFLDWGLGAHWARFNNNFKIGWVKEDEHEWEYTENNFLWSTLWDDSFATDSQFNLFCERVRKFGYETQQSVVEAIYAEVPSVLQLDYIKNYFDISYKLLTLWEDYPQLYIFLKGTKK